jgi:hypothetical protein
MSTSSLSGPGSAISAAHHRRDQVPDRTFVILDGRSPVSYLLIHYIDESVLQWDFDGHEVAILRRTRCCAWMPK